MRSDSVKNMSAYADQNHAPSLAAARLVGITGDRTIQADKRRRFQTVLRTENSFKRSRPSQDGLPRLPCEQRIASSHGLRFRPLDPVVIKTSKTIIKREGVHDTSSFFMQILKLCFTVANPMSYEH